MEKNVSLEKGRYDSFDQSIRSNSDEVNLKKLLDKSISILQEYFRKPKDHEIKQDLKQKYEQEVENYKKMLD